MKITELRVILELIQVIQHLATAFEGLTAAWLFISLAVKVYKLSLVKRMKCLLKIIARCFTGRKWKKVIICQGKFGICYNILIGLLFVCCWNQIFYFKALSTFNNQTKWNNPQKTSNWLEKKSNKTSSSLPLHSHFKLHCSHTYNIKSKFPTKGNLHLQLPNPPSWYHIQRLLIHLVVEW